MRVILCSVLVLVAYGPLTAIMAQDGKATQSAQPVAGEEVVLASQVLQRASQQGAQCNELLLDLETAHAALLTVTCQASDDSETYEAVLPWQRSLPDEPLDGNFWKQLLRAPSESMDRAFADRVYSAAKKEIYWFEELVDSKSAEKFDTKKYQLTRLSDLTGQAVQDKSGKPLGKIVDLGINDETGAIVYCVLESKDSKLRAIPLAAFVADSHSKTWHIDLDSEQVFAFETSDLDEPPQSVARGWQEYVAVKYGRTGLQQATEKDTDKDTEKDTEKSPNKATHQK